MRNIFLSLTLIALMALPLTPVLAAGEVVIYTGITQWIGKAAADEQAKICVGMLDDAGIKNTWYDSADQAEDLADWMESVTGDDGLDICVLYGDFPPEIYPEGNTQPDGSIAEAFIETTDGDVFINHADYMFWGVSSGNGIGGLQNMMDINGITMWDDDTPMVVTPEGKAISPSLTDYASDRPFHVDELEGNWEVEVSLAQNDDGTRADPIIVRDGNLGRLIPAIQTAQGNEPKGAIAAEIITWLMSTTPVTDSPEGVPESTASVTVSISPSPVQSPAPGEQLVLNLNIARGEDVAGYQATVQFDTTALRYVSSANGSYLPAGAFVVPSVVSGNQVTLGATSLNGGSQGDGTLATLTFEVVAVKPSSVILSEVKLTDMNADFLSVSSENGEVVGPGTPTQTSDTKTVVSLTPSPVASPALGEQLTFNISIVNGKNVAGYAFKLAFDATALRYISSNNADYLPTGAFAIPPVVSGNQVTLSAVSPSGESDGSGTLATLTFEVITAKPSTLRFSGVSLTDGDGNALEVSSENGEVVESVDIRGDVNGDGIVNLEDMAAAAGHLGRTSENTADMNGDGVVNAADLLLIAAAIGQGNAAPSLHSVSVVHLFTAAEVRHWLWLARQVDLTDPMHQKGFLLLEQLLAILTPKETSVLPNYPNPFNPETWIPYHLSKPASVTVSIYAADGRLVRRLVLGHQSAGIYESRSRAAYWDGRNDLGEPVASGVYFYTLTAGDFAATRKLLIRK